MKDDELVSLRKFAEYMEVSPTNVGKWIDKGKIPEKCFDRTNPKFPKIWKLKAEKCVNDSIDKKKQHVNNSLPEGSNNPDRNRGRVDGKTRGRSKMESDLKDFKEDLSTEALMKLTYADLLNLKEAKAVQLQQIKIDEAEGRLVDRAVTHKKLYDFGNTVCEAIESITDRIIDRLVGKDRDTMYNILQKEIKSALNILTDPVKDAGI